MMAGMILRKNIFRKFFQKNSKKHICGVFVTLNHLFHYKMWWYLWRHVNFSKIASCSLQLHSSTGIFLFCNDVNGPKFKTQHIFGLFSLSQISIKREFSHIRSFHRMLKHQHLHQFQPNLMVQFYEKSPWIPLFLKTFPLWAFPYMQRQNRIQWFLLGVWLINRSYNLTEQEVLLW